MFGFGASAALIWFGIAAGMAKPRYLNSYLLNIGQLDDSAAGHLAARLSEVPGVAEAVVVAADGVAYLKVDRDRLDETALHDLAGAHG